MRSKWLIFVLVLSLAINAAVLATMGYHYYLSASTETSAPCPLSPGDSHLYQSLGLSDPQLSKMEPLAQKFHSRLAELGTAMEGKRELLVDLLAKDGDPAGIENLRREMASIQDEIQREVISHIIETKKILDAKQQQRFFDLMKQSMASGKSSMVVNKGRASDEPALHDERTLLPEEKDSDVNPRALDRHRPSDHSQRSLIGLPPGSPCSSKRNRGRYNSPAIRGCPQGPGRSGLSLFGGDDP